MKNFITTADWSQAELQTLIDQAIAIKQGLSSPSLQGRSIALIFFNPSLRTRASFELGAWHLGAKAIILEPGKNAWPLEFSNGNRMDGDAEEHVKEVARVLSNYCDLIAVRAFPSLNDWQKDRQDGIVNSFATYASVPVINMESITHPCQELAHMQTLQEKLGSVANKKYLLSWTYHPKPLNSAVANSSLLIATKFGMDVTLLCPDESYLLDTRYLSLAKQQAQIYGGSFNITHDIAEGYRDAEVVYAKSWGSLDYFGRWTQEKKQRDRYQHFIVDQPKMDLTRAALFSHCLPLRRNVKATDEVMDSKYCVAIEEATNRLYVQQALMYQLVHPVS